MPRKEFQIGEVLTAANVNTFLMDQAVMSFDDDAARGSAIPTPVEGMTTFRDDEKAVEVYANGNWNTVSQATSFNYIINGAFDVWQRGTAVPTGTSAATIYNADRWGTYRGAFATGVTTSQRAAALTGFEFSARVQRDSGNTSTSAITFGQALPNNESIPLAGKTATLSFWAKRGANYSSASNALTASIRSGTGTNQNLSAGIVGGVFVATDAITLTTEWQRFQISGTVPSNALQIFAQFGYTPSGTAGADDWFEVTGVQLEAGSVATPFKRHAPSLQGELAACQRYYYRTTATAGGLIFANAYANSTTQARGAVHFPTTMRVAPTSLDQSGTALDYRAQRQGTTTVDCSAIPGFIAATENAAQFTFTFASGLTAGEGLQLRSGAVNAFLGWSAEL